MADLARMIGGDTDKLVLRHATVTAAPSAGTVTLRFGTGATPIPGVKMLASAATSVVNGDVVWVLEKGYDLLVLGPIGTSTPVPQSVGAFRVNPDGTIRMAMTNGALELSGWLDFHLQRAADEATDYDVRMVNDAAGYLTLQSPSTMVLRGMNIVDFPDETRDIKVDLWGGTYGLGVRSSELYLRSGGQNIGFECPPGSWAMRIQGTADALIYPSLTSNRIYMNSHLNMRFNTICFRGDDDWAHRIVYVSSIGSPANGTQSYDGPLMFGYYSSGLANGHFGNIDLRAWDSGGDYRLDSYCPHHMLQGMFVDGGTKSFLIDHPVLGPDFHLQYAAIEGPSVDLLWRGKITLVGGVGVINLDDEVGQEEGTFEALTFEEDRQFFLYNETGTANPRGEWVPGAGDINVSCDDQDATIGWLVLATRKAGLTADSHLDEDGRLLVEWQKNDLERSTTKKQLLADQIDEQVAELTRWRDAVPGAEQKFNAIISEHGTRQTEWREHQQQGQAHRDSRRAYWAAQKDKALARREAKRGNE